MLTLAIALAPRHAPAHDASGWGGLFRTRDAGVTWLHVNPGSFVSGALAVAVSPVDPNHLLLATDTGVARSRNGGRDWAVEAPDVFVGPAFAATFDVDGQRALVAGGSEVFRSEGDRWRRLRTPSGSMPARALVAGGARGRVYLSGRSKLYRTDDWGQSWVNIGGALNAEHAGVVVVPRDQPDGVYAVAGGRLWASTDAGRRWELRGDGLPGGGIEALAVDPAEAGRLWSVVSDQVFRSDDQGRRWRPVGAPFQERPVVARGLAVGDHAILVATDRGVFRGTDDGARWALVTDTLPAHLDAGVLARDPVEPATIYAGFALTPHEQLARRTAETGGMLSRIPPGQMAGGLGVLVLAVVAAVVGGRLRRRADRPGSGPVQP
jgi:photosystem II stability/assembly factor-like uncharacterized protein